VSRPTPRVPDAAILSARPFGDPALARILRDEPLCVAVSGGADSVALLHTLVRLRAWLGAKPPYGLAAAHFHHGIRGAEADADATFVAELCASLGVPLRTGRGDVPAEAARTGESPEMAARRLRHAFLRDVACGRPVATGHTLDDQAELFFLRLKRGASARGLSGMRPFEPQSGSAPARLRPFLHVRHDALVAFLRDEGLAWREDATNAADDADRNRIRHRIVPAALDAFGPSFLSTLARTMDILRDDADLLESLARADDDSSRPEFADSPSLRRRRIAATLYASGVDPETVTLDAIERIRGLLDAQHGGAVPLGGGVVARVRRGALLVERPAP
jgi:tRNA(Ile)-lysidine synthetase-like protein